MSKVIVPLNCSVWVESNVTKKLHPHNGINEEKHDHQHHHIWQGLKNILLFESEAKKKSYELI